MASAQNGKIEPVRGPFSDSLPGLRERVCSVAFLPTDGDWYSSTTNVLENLSEQVVPEWVPPRVSGLRVKTWDGIRTSLNR